MIRSYPYRHTRRGVLLVVVLLILSLAVVAEMLTTRYLINLRRHVHLRQQTIQQRIAQPEPRIMSPPAPRASPPR